MRRHCSVSTSQASTSDINKFFCCLPQPVGWVWNGGTPPFPNFRILREVDSEQDSEDDSPLASRRWRTIIVHKTYLFLIASKPVLDGQWTEHALSKKAVMTQTQNLTKTLNVYTRRGGGNFRKVFLAGSWKTEKKSPSLRERLAPF